MYGVDCYLVWLIQLEFCKREMSATLKSLILMHFIYIIFLYVHF